MSYGEHHAIRTDSAPEALGPYSQAVRAGPWLFCSGQIPLDPATGVLIGGGFDRQAERVLANLEGILTAAGMGFGNVVKVTVYLTDLGNFAALNAIYAKRFRDPYPARATVQVTALPKGALLEIDLIALG